MRWRRATGRCNRSGIAGASPREQDSRAARDLRYVLLGCAVLGTVFLFLLATASANTALFAGNYNLLLVLNGTMVVVLMGLVGYQLWRLRKNLKAGVFGSRLAVRLVLLFALVAVLPGALLYGVSVQFLGKSIESWFDVRVDRALEGGLNLGRNALDYLLKETTNKATQLALTLQEGEPGGMAAQPQSRQRAGGDLRGGAVLFDRRRARGRRHFGLDAPRRSRRRRRRCAARGCSRPIRAIEQSADQGLLLRVVVPVNSVGSQRAAAAAAGRRAGAEAAAAGCREGAGRLPRLPGDLVFARRAEAPLCADADADACCSRSFPRWALPSCCPSSSAGRSGCSPKARARSRRATSAAVIRCRAATSSACSPNRSTR